MGKFAIGSAFTLLLSSFAAVATAQSSTVRILDVARGAAHGGRALTEINYADCLAADSVRFALELRGTEGLALEVWAGDHCDSRSNRSPGTATCWKIYNVQAHDDLNTVELGVRDLLYGRTKAGVEAATDGGTSQGEPACVLSSAVTAPQVLTTYLMLMDRNFDVSGVSEWKFTYRLRGSPPPTLDSVASGDRQLSAIFSLDNTDQYLAGVQLFCDPARMIRMQRRARRR